MPPKGKGQKGLGGKNKRRGKNTTNDDKNELILKEEGQEYAFVSKMLGNGRLSASCMDGKDRLCHIRGKMRKKQWVNQGDVILIGLRDFQDEKADVIHKYSSEEARKLRANGALPESMVEGGGKGNLEVENDPAEECVFDFEDI